MSNISNKRLFLNVGLLLVLLGLVINFGLLAYRHRTAQTPNPNEVTVFRGTKEGVVEARVALDTSAALSPADLKRLMEQEGARLVVLDTRERDEFARGHIPSSVNIPHDELYSRAEDELSKSSLIVISYCDCGQTFVAAQLQRDVIRELGFADIKILTGGYDDWARAGLATESGR